MILLIDNYDSFTWNLVQSMAGQGAQVRVERNDALSPEQALSLRPSAVVLSPGPGRPEQAGISPALLSLLPEHTPVLGVCLGHQVLVTHYGGGVVRDPRPTHGRAARVHHGGGLLYADLPDPFEAGRYHSLGAVEPLPEELELEAWTADGLIMGVRHRDLPRFGVQFHPESILTPDGDRLMARFLALAGVAPAANDPGRENPALAAPDRPGSP